MPTDLLTEAELAEYLDVPVDTVRYWRRQGTGPVPVRLPNRRVRYRHEVVDKWVESQEQQSRVRSKKRHIKAV